MTLDEAVNATYAPVQDILLKAIEKAEDKEDFKEIEKAMHSVSDEQYGFDSIALKAIENPPHDEKHSYALRLISSKKRGNLDELAKSKEAIKLLLEFIGELKLWNFGWKWVAEQLMNCEENMNKQWTKEEDKCN